MIKSCDANLCVLFMFDSSFCFDLFCLFVYLLLQAIIEGTVVIYAGNQVVSWVLSRGCHQEGEDEEHCLQHLGQLGQASKIKPKVLSNTIVVDWVITSCFGWIGMFMWLVR